MNGPDILSISREELASAIAARKDDIPQYSPLKISPWLAMSLLQKAIRRGREDFALRAAATLLDQSPSRFWRRIGVIVFEDIGVADYEMLSLVVAALTGKVWRKKLGGEWVVASYIVSKMVHAINCRAADDLAYVCEHHPDYEDIRLDLTFKSLPDLFRRISGKGPLAEKALALWYAVGTHRCPSNILRERRGEPYAVFDHLCEIGYPPSVVEVAREGFKKGAWILPAFYVLLWKEAQGASSKLISDELPEEELIGGIPSWAFDVHVREGRQALARFLQSDCETALWIKTYLPNSKQLRFLGGILYRIESGLVAKRMQWDVGTKLKHMADVESRGLSSEEILTVMDLLRYELPLLNDARWSAIASNS